MFFKNTKLMTSLVNEALESIENSFRRYNKISLLFSGGKDSTVLLHLTEQISNKLNKDYEIIHIDTGDNFEEILNFRDKKINKLGRKLLIEHIMPHTSNMSKNRLQSFALNKAIAENSYDIVLGGGRRDEGKARQKELFFSRRQVNEGWDSNNIEVEILNYRGLGKEDQDHFRVFPLNNWNEIDIWIYIDLYKINICNLYYSHKRFYKEKKELVRYRTIGDRNTSIPILSLAKTPHEVAIENYKSKFNERALREDDNFSEFSMEIRKREGYF